MVGQWITPEIAATLENSRVAQMKLKFEKGHSDKQFAENAEIRKYAQEQDAKNASERADDKAYTRKLDQRNFAGNYLNELQSMTGQRQNSYARQKSQQMQVQNAANDWRQYAAQNHGNFRSEHFSAMQPPVQDTQHYAQPPVNIQSPQQSSPFGSQIKSGIHEYSVVNVAQVPLNQVSRALDVCSTVNVLILTRHFRLARSTDPLQLLLACISGLPDKFAQGSV